MGKKEDIEKQLKQLQEELKLEETKGTYPEYSTSKQVMTWGLANMIISALTFLFLVIIVIASK